MSLSSIYATPFPVTGQGARVGCRFFNVATGMVVTGWTNPMATAYPDSASGQSCSIVESPSGSGVGYIDIPASVMAASMVQVNASISNSSASAFSIDLYPVNLAQFNGRYDAQTVLRLEQMLLDLHVGVGLNGASQTGASMLMLNPDGSTHFSGSVYENTTSAVRSKMN